MRTWHITTLAEGRIKSKATMEHTIEADNWDDACYEARMAHISRKHVAMDRSIFVLNIYCDL